MVVFFRLFLWYRSLGLQSRFLWLLRGVGKKSKTTPSKSKVDSIDSYNIYGGVAGRWGVHILVRVHWLLVLFFLQLIPRGWPNYSTRYVSKVFVVGE